MNRAESSFSSIIPQKSFWSATVLFLSIVLPSNSYGQFQEKPLHIFGYYQNAFEYNVSNIHPNSNTFLTQQLNIIAQKDLSTSFRSFVNLEFINTFDGNLGWGSASLKEAWVRYDVSPKFKLKMGLQVPIFNYLNEIKTRTPLLPYVVRPIVYEESLREIILIEEYIPERAFLQAYGSFPNEPISFDYALFLGNSQNINNDSNNGQTGVDSTNAILIGGRLGLLWNNLDSNLSELKLGVSSTFDRVNIFTGVGNLVTNDSLEQNQISRSLEETSRWRIGVDLALYWKQFYVQSELISVIYGEDSEILDVDRVFYYATAGMWVSEKLEAYISYWRTNEVALLRDRRQDPLFRLDQKIVFDIYTIGARYNITPRLVLKAQAALGDINLRDTIRDANDLSEIKSKEDLSTYTIALSVFF